MVGVFEATLLREEIKSSAGAFWCCNASFENWIGLFLATYEACEWLLPVLGLRMDPVWDVRSPLEFDLGLEWLFSANWLLPRVASFLLEDDPKPIGPASLLF
jgi:hypothetical protein